MAAPKGNQLLSGGSFFGSTEMAGEVDTRRISKFERDWCADPKKYSRSWPDVRVRVAVLVDSPWFQFSMIAVILVNLVLVIAEVDLLADGDTNDYPMWVEGASIAFMILYTSEILLRIFAHRVGFFLSAQNLFDFMLVLADVCVTTTGAVTHTMDGTSNFAIFRVARLLRIVRSARLLFSYRSLYLLINGFSHAVKGVIWALLMITLTLILCSCFAVAVIHPLNEQLAEKGLYDGCERCPRAFSSVWNSYLTFFQQIIAGDSWGLVTLPIMEAHPWTALFFIPIITFIQLGLVNLIVAVIVERAAEAREANRAMMLEMKQIELDKMKQDMFEVCSELDADQDGVLTLLELLAAFDKPGEFRENMKIMDIDKDDMRMVFQIMDEDKSGGVTYKEFVHNLYKMKTQDSHTLLVFIKGCVADIRWHVERQMSELVEKLRGSEWQDKFDTHRTATANELQDMCLSPTVDTVKPSGPYTESTVPCSQVDFSKLLKDTSDKIDKQLRTLSQLLPANVATGCPVSPSPSHVGSQWQLKLNTILASAGEKSTDVAAWSPKRRAKFDASAGEKSTDMVPWSPKRRHDGISSNHLMSLHRSSFVSESTGTQKETSIPDLAQPQHLVRPTPQKSQTLTVPSPKNENGSTVASSNVR